MMTTKITNDDFKKSKVLREHSQRSREVARALDVKADALPQAHFLIDVPQPRPVPGQRARRAGTL